jgi:hypothetical protein
MGINKKELIAQISQNVKASAGETLAVGVGRSDVLPANEEQKVQVQEKARKISRTKSKPVVPAFHGSSGRQAAFWLDDEDRGILREVGMSLYAQGIKPSDNLVLRAALRLMPRDHRLIEQIKALLERDGRRVRHRDKSSE